ncbi:hypothetical protein GCM10009574_058300 [Streptomyces asiaticus]|uniref:Uncharacterized protein n=2 Tax=Streptomyces rhizosphaericus TaxID=114699 RepID=A0ABN1PH28_9ACTN
MVDPPFPKAHTSATMATNPFPINTAFLRPLLAQSVLKSPQHPPGARPRHTETNRTLPNNYLTNLSHDAETSTFHTPRTTTLRRVNRATDPGNISRTKRAKSLE